MRIEITPDVSPAYPFGRNHIALLAMYACTISMFGCTRSYIRPDLNEVGRVVYANKDIAAGSMIRASVLEERDIEYRQIPEDALTGGTVAAGRIARIKINSGQLVCQRHLAPQGSCEPDNYNIEAEKEWRAALAKFEKSDQ
jgi:hypothetical protein